MGTHKPTGTGADFVTALLSQSLVSALDRHIAEQAPHKTRSDALRDAFKEWCIDQGYINGNDIDRELN